MPSNIIDELAVLIKGDDSNLSKTLEQSTAKLAKWGAAAGAAATAATAALVKSGLDSADAQAKLALTLNTTSESITTLERAGSLAGVSMDSVAQATKDLTRRLSQAEVNGGGTADALKKLHLNANELAQLPLDERIATINTALYEFTTAGERAAVAGQLFGEEGSLAMLRITPDTIKQAAFEVKKFDAALTEVDAAKIEMANDTMSQLGLAFDGLTKHMAAQFAPILGEISNRLADATSETGGMGNVAEEAFNMVITGAGYAADAFRGINLVVSLGEVAFKGFKLAALEAVTYVVEAFDDMGNSISETMNDMIDGLNHIPGVDIERLVVGEGDALKAMKELTAEATEDFKAANKEFIELAREPLPSEKLKGWAEEVKAAADAAAKDVVAAKKEIAAVEIPPLIGGLTEEEREKQKEALQASLEETMTYLQTEEEMLGEAWQKRAESLQASFEQGLISQQQYNEQAERLNQDHADKMNAIDNAANAAKLQVAGKMFGNLATLMQTENKRMFEIGKVAAIAQATVNGIEATISSYKAGSQIGGPVLGAAFAATAAVATGVQLSKLSSTTYGSGAAPGTPGSGVGSTSITQDATTSANAVSNTTAGGTLTVQGLDSTALLTGDTVNALVEELLTYQEQGGTIVLEG